MLRTTRWGLRYPESTDDPDVPRDIKNLAMDLDGVAMDRHAENDGGRGMPGRAGTYFYNRTRQILTRDDGTRWNTVSSEREWSAVTSEVSLTSSYTDLMWINSATLRGMSIVRCQFAAVGSNIGVRLLGYRYPTATPEALLDPSGRDVWTATLNPANGQAGFRAWATPTGWAQDWSTAGESRLALQAVTGGTATPAILFTTTTEPGYTTSTRFVLQARGVGSRILSGDLTAMSL